MIYPYTRQTALTYKIRETSGYGWRTITKVINGVKKKVRSFHKGVDHAAIIKVKGTQVIATLNGEVRTGYVTEQAGNFVEVTGYENGTKFDFLTCHHDLVVVKNGTQVKVGDVIATIGSTGNSTAPHIHIQVKKNGKIVNPNLYMDTLATRVEATPFLGAIIRQRPTRQSNKIGKLNWRQKTIGVRTVKGESVNGNVWWYELSIGGFISATVLKEVI